MSAVAARRSWPIYAIPGAVLIALLGMFIAAVWHAQIGVSVLLDGLIVASFVAALAGAVGGLILANTRRNVMWILAVALATTALLALIAMVLSAMASGWPRPT